MIHEADADKNTSVPEPTPRPSSPLTPPSRPRQETQTKALQTLVALATHPPSRITQKASSSAPSAPRLAISQTVATTPGFENPPIVVPERPEQESVELDWDQVPEAEKPFVTKVDHGELAK